MKKSSLILMLLLSIVSIDAMAQSMPAMFKYYRRGSKAAEHRHVEWMDSVAFVTENYDVYVSSETKITTEGQWALEVYVSGALSVEERQVCVVPANYTEEEILSAYEQGTLPDLRTMEDSIRYTDFVCEDGAYKPVAFGLDKEGKMRSHSIGQEVNISADYQSSLLEPLMYGEFYNTYEWGYGSLMHIRDVMGEELTMNTPHGYDCYYPWTENTGIGSGYRTSQYIWLYFDNAIQKFSETISALDVPGIRQNPVAKVYLGTALAMRAMHYLDAARMYEYLPTDGTSSTNEAGNDVLNLTYPIGYAKEFAADETREVRRATKEEMIAYIDNELNRAQALLEGESVTDKELASASVIHGLKARLYLWAGDYESAQAYAEKAIHESNCQVLTESEWLDVQRGFNDSSASSWLWAMKYKPNSPCVNTGILNWASWCSNQTTFGYTGFTGMYTLISTSAYNQISDTDFRKKSFKAPYGSTLYGQETYPDGLYPDNFPDLAALKFRPGQGNINDYTIAAVVDVPLMRIEEMHFIRMEALAQRGDVAAAKAELEAFISTNRDSQYSISHTEDGNIIDEIFKHKRIEFWGEGLNFFDYKRLNKPVVRSYEGTNVPEAYRLNTTTRPAWMNFVFVKNAYSGKIQDWNNPDPSGCYK